MINDSLWKGSYVLQNKDTIKELKRIDAEHRLPKYKTLFARFGNTLVRHRVLVLSKICRYTNCNVGIRFSREFIYFSKGGNFA